MHAHPLPKKGPEGHEWHNDERNDGPRHAESPTLLECLGAQFPEVLHKHNTPQECRTVCADGLLAHRLDFLTRGLIVCARSVSAWHDLRQAFSSKKQLGAKDSIVEKYYLARLSTAEFSMMPEMPFEILVPLDHHRKSRHKMEVLSTGQQSKTWIYPIADSSYAVIRIFTGLQHQIRVVCQALGRVLHNDPVYLKKQPSIYIKRNIQVRLLNADERGGFESVLEPALGCIAAQNNGTPQTNPAASLKYNPIDAYYLHAFALRLFRRLHFDENTD